MGHDGQALAQPRRGSQLYVLATAFLSLFCIVGFVVYGLPFFYSFMMDEHGWSRTFVTSGNTVSKLLVAPLFGFFAGWLIDRYGPRRLMVAGALIAAGGVIGLSLADTPALFYLFYVFNALGYVFGGPLPCQVLISRRFEQNRGKAMGVAYLGIGAGGAVVPLLAHALERQLGWHGALAALGLLIALIAIPLPLLMAEKKAEAPAAPLAPAPALTPMREILRNPHFYLLGLGSMCSIGAVSGTYQHLKLYLSGAGYAQADTARVMSLVLLSSIAGRLLMGWLADGWNRKRVMLLIYLVVAGSIPLLLAPEFPGRIHLFAVLFGIGLGGDYMIIPLMAGDLFGVRALGRTMGIILVADGVAEASVPTLVSALYDTASKSYTLGFSALIALALAGAAIISCLPRTLQQGGRTQDRR